jgi:plastocyanin
MKFKNPTFVVVALSLVSLSLALPRTVTAQQVWKATLGAQSKDMGKQAIAFLPNELWIHANDSITWTSAADEIHTVSFFKPGQAYERVAQGSHRTRRVSTAPNASAHLRWSRGRALP